MEKEKVVNHTHLLQQEISKLNKKLKDGQKVLVRFVIYDENGNPLSLNNLGQLLKINN